MHDEEEDEDEELELEDPRKPKVIGKGGVYHHYKVGKPLCKFYFLILGQLILSHCCWITPTYFLRIYDI